VTPQRDREGFTLIEMLAVVLSIVVVLGAATGFMITAVTRQRAVLSASQLEASHSQLAAAISNAIKTADDFQIFESSSVASINQEYYSRGVPFGNYLSCRHDGGSVGVIEEDFEFISGLPTGRLTQRTKFLTTGKPEGQRTYDSAGITKGSCFSMKDGILQAHWQVFTMMDRVDFNVYAMPLNMR
jgi:type II secretory pathway pseudopilin PulG